MAKDREFFYHYDCEGNLVFKEFKEMALRGGIVAPINKGKLETELGITFRAFGTGWRYDWQSNGMLARVVRPDGKEVSFAYDALGRRIRKTYAGTTSHFVWDGNVPLHEWTEEAEENVVTWLFEQDTFVPAAKFVANGDCFSIISNYLGTPLQAYDKQGNKVWEQELDIYGRQRKRPSAFIPFKYQGQYEDAETGLYYNRFRYYDPNAGSYISQDPIGLEGGNPTQYGYVSDSNNWLDSFGLSNVQEYNISSHGSQPSPRSPYQSHHIVQDEWAKAQGLNGYSSRQAPAILLNAEPDPNQHAIITSRQNARRDARIAGGKWKWSTTLKQELKYARADLKAAGVPEKVIRKAIKTAKEYFKGLH